MEFPSFHLQLPFWLSQRFSNDGGIWKTPEERMHLAIELARANVANGTGGPFGAAIFEIGSGRLVAPGVNLVVSMRCSVLHAEMVAIMIAQNFRHHYDLDGPDFPPCELVTSCEPCAMCLGAIPWSGVRSLVCGARDEDARRIGFDEGAKPADWIAALQQRGIAVYRDILRTEAAQVLMDYRDGGGVIYNSRKE
ncbi:MAG: nucleoside deaminase [Sedimentisphaerales bacterium]|nr:nucleoside deaminase [Sedimentisphaerales bacterium]